MILNKNNTEIKIHLDKLNLSNYKEHHIEQFIFRIYCCKYCLLKKKCKFCHCNPLDKIIEPTSCNKKVYPDILNNEKWIMFKTKHNISYESL